MIHPLFALFNGLVIFLFSLFVQENDPRISSKLPENLQINRESVMEVHITKAEMEGFASFQLDLPPAFSIREIESSQGRFSLNEGQAQWTWDELPEQEELVLVLGITPLAGSEGKRNISGTFYYIENNEKKSRDLASSEIEVLPGTESQAAASDSSRTQAKAAEEGGHAEPNGKLDIERSLAEGNQPGEKRIDITIRKGLTRGFARYSDILPEGFSAKAFKTEGGSFSVADGKIKFVWVSVPDKEELHISYLLWCKSETREITLKGEYSYLEHNQSKKIDVPDLIVSFDQAIQNKTESVAQTNKTETGEDPKKTSPAQEETIERLAEQSKKQAGKPTFAIQIGAFTNAKVNAQTLKRRFKINEKIRSEMQEGYAKFMIGTHALYTDARSKRNTVVMNNGVKSAFVVAYNNGKRITVQEALMVLNQKWFK